jgi:hypothetical protein
MGTVRAKALAIDMDSTTPQERAIAAESIIRRERTI